MKKIGTSPIVVSQVTRQSMHNVDVFLSKIFCFSQMTKVGISLLYIKDD